MGEGHCSVVLLDVTAHIVQCPVPLVGYLTCWWSLLPPDRLMIFKIEALNNGGNSFSNGEDVGSNRQTDGLKEAIIEVNPERSMRAKEKDTSVRWLSDFFINCLNFIHEKKDFIKKETQ